MRKGLLAIVLLTPLALSGCAVNTIFRCVDHPVVCAALGAGVAGGVYLWQQGYFDEGLP